MIDYSFKQKVLESGLPIEQRKVSKAIYADYALHSTGEVVKSKYTLQQALDIAHYYEKHCPSEWVEAQRINYASYKRVKRLKDKIAKMLESPCIFLTFTFNDKTLQNTSAKTRRRIVRGFLSEYNTDYVANIDFGSENGREHYHALIKSDNVDYSKYTYGAINGERVRSASDSVKLAKYISKLTNHAIKDTAKGSRMIYNR